MNRAELEHLIPTKDLDFVQVMLHERMLNLETLAERAASLPVPSDRLELTRERLRRLQTAP
jgi:hypothetical protein